MIIRNVYRELIYKQIYDFKYSDLIWDLFSRLLNAPKYKPTLAPQKLLVQAALVYKPQMSTLYVPWDFPLFFKLINKIFDILFFSC